MRELFELVRRVARTESSVLLRGETGTGKDLVAGAIHALSRRSGGPFCAINCATLTGEHLASELFGHVKGAYTGAIRDRVGLFAQADGGTLFLDEVAEIPRDIQARLLRVLQEQQFVPLGGSEPVRVDVRVLSATHQALRTAVAEHRFREDLMYRIRVVPLYLPRLAERHGDVELLAWHFIDEFNARGERQISSIRTDALHLMRVHPWPGNVRELRNVIEYAFAIGMGPELQIGCLTPEVRGEAPPGEPCAGANDEARIRAALAGAGGRKAVAANDLGWSRTKLWRRMRELGI